MDGCQGMVKGTQQLLIRGRSVTWRPRPPETSQERSQQVLSSWSPKASIRIPTARRLFGLGKPDESLDGYSNEGFREDFDINSPRFGAPVPYMNVLRDSKAKPTDRCYVEMMPGWC
jgi:hypothetical protein